MTEFSVTKDLQREKKTFFSSSLNNMRQKTEGNVKHEVPNDDLEINRPITGAHIKQ